MMRRTLLTLAALIALTPAATAESVYACDGGAFITTNAYEARVSVKGAGGFSIAMPLATAGDHVIVWSPHGETAVDERYAPHVPYVVQTFREGQWFPNGTASETSFDLGGGEVQCALMR